MRVETSESVTMEGGNYVSESGQYHLVIENAYESTNGPDAKFEMRVLDGTTKSEIGKRYDHAFFLPDMSQDDDKIEKQKSLNAAFLIAIDLVKPDQLGKAVDIDVEPSIGRQCIMHLERKMEKNQETGKWDIPTKFMKPAFANIYHVDDPEAKDIPKSAEALKQIGDTFPGERHDAKYFDFKKKKNGGGSAKQTASVGAGTDKSFDDLFE